MNNTLITRAIALMVFTLPTLSAIAQNDLTGCEAKQSRFCPQVSATYKSLALNSTQRRSRCLILN